MKGGGGGREREKVGEWRMGRRGRNRWEREP